MVTKKRRKLLSNKLFLMKKTLDHIFFLESESVKLFFLEKQRDLLLVLYSFLFFRTLNIFCIVA